MITLPDFPKDIVYDPYNQTINRDPHALWKRMRDEAPLYYNEQYDFYALSRFDDVHSALQNTVDYTSEYGTLIETIDGVIAGKIPRFGQDNMGMMIFTDPPAHDVLRRLVTQHFSPRAVGQYELRARELASQLLDKFVGESTFDIVDEVIRPIPPMMVGEIIGVPEADQAHLGTLVDDALTYDPESGPDEIEDGLRKGKDSHRKIAEYMAMLVKQRQQKPQNDLVTLLAQAELDFGEGKRILDIQELIGFLMLLQSAGSETTARALGWAMLLLARHPEQRQKLIDDPRKIRGAVEEILRYEAPSPIQARMVNNDVVWHGVTIPSGSKIALLNGSAVRDDRFFPDADNFDVDRQIPRHVSFGIGTHVCLGAALARLEIRVVIEEILKRFPRWEVDESRVEMVCTTTVRGPSKVPITVS